MIVSRKSVVSLAVLCVFLLCSCSQKRVPLPNRTTPELEEYYRAKEENGGVVYNPNTDPEKESQLTSDEDEYGEPCGEDDPIMSSGFASYFLSPETIDVNQTPLLYDYVYSCLDWHVPIHRDLISSDLYILRNVNEPYIIFTDRYVVQGDIITPPTGQHIETIILEPDDLSELNKAVDALPEEYIVRDGDWELYIVEETLSSTGIVFWHSALYSAGNMPPFKSAQEGWPTEWLRREPYLLALRKEGINMENTWWDEWRYEGVYKIVPTEQSENQEFAATITCVAEDIFMYQSNEMDEPIQRLWSDLQEFCSVNGYSVPGHFDPTPAIIGTPA